MIYTQLVSIFYILYQCHSGRWMNTMPSQPMDTCAVCHLSPLSRCTFHWFARPHVSQGDSTPTEMITYLQKQSLHLELFFFTPAAPPRGEVRCNLQIRWGWMNVHLCRPEVTTHVTTPGEGLWEGGQLAALTRLQGARCHIPGALGLPLEPSATDPSDGMCGSASPRRREGAL